MIAEGGLAALWLAGALAALQLLLAALGLRQTADGADSPLGATLLAGTRPVAVVQGALAAVAMACLIGVFLHSDMSVKLVVENSHSAKPWLYKFAGAWGTTRARCSCG